MLKPLVTLLIKLVPVLVGVPIMANDPAHARAAKSAETIVEVVERRLPPARRELFARIEMAWGYGEASWFASPRGHNDDKQACGVMQVHHPEKYVKGTCEDVRSDLFLGYAAGLEVLLELEAKCGSVLAALTAYSTDGACKPYVLPLVRFRCKRAGLTSDCELTP